MTYMPVDGKPDRMHVGARALDLTKWIEINSDYEIDLAQKQDLLSMKHDEVFYLSRWVMRAREKFLNYLANTCLEFFQNAGQTKFLLTQACIHLKLRHYLCKKTSA